MPKSTAKADRYEIASFSGYCRAFFPNLRSINVDLPESEKARKGSCPLGE